MKEHKEIIKKLDKIVFHDVPVEKISFKTEYSTDFIIDFIRYQEFNKKYDYQALKFIGIKKLKADSLELNSVSDLEIYSFDYQLGKLFECKIIFLLGTSQQSFEVELYCETIELISNKTKL